MEHERSLNLEAGTTFTLRWWHTGGVGPTAGPCLVCISLLLCHRQPFRMLGLAHIAKRGFCSTQVRTITGIFLFFFFFSPFGKREGSWGKFADKFSECVVLSYFINRWQLWEKNHYLLSLLAICCFTWVGKLYCYTWNVLSRCKWLVQESLSVVTHIRIPSV